MDFASQVVDKLQPLKKNALKLTRNADEAEDLMQTTVVKALTHQDQFDGRNLGAWLNVMMMRIFLSMKRGRKFDRLMIVQGSFDEATTAPDPTAHLVFDQRLELIETLEHLARIDQRGALLNFAFGNLGGNQTYLKFIKSRLRRDHD